MFPRAGARGRPARPRPATPGPSSPTWPTARFFAGTTPVSPAPTSPTRAAAVTARCSVGVPSRRARRPTRPTLWMCAQRRSLRGDAAATSGASSIRPTTTTHARRTQDAPSTTAPRSAPPTEIGPSVGLAATSRSMRAPATASCTRIARRWRTTRALSRTRSPTCARPPRTTEVATASAASSPTSRCRPLQRT